MSSLEHGLFSSEILAHSQLHIKSTGHTIPCFARFIFKVVLECHSKYTRSRCILNKLFTSAVDEMFNTSRISNINTRRARLFPVTRLPTCKTRIYQMQLSKSIKVE